MAKKTKKTTKVKVSDLKPKKDVKGGMINLRTRE